MGGENPHRPVSPRQRSKARDAGWDRSAKPCFSPRRPDFERPGCAQAGPKGCSWTCWGKPGVSAQSCQGRWHFLCLGANERPLMRSLCHQQEPGPSHCQPTGKGRGCIPPQLGTLLGPQNILGQADEGVPAPPLWQPLLFKGYLPQILGDYKGRCLRSELGTYPPPFLFHSRRAAGQVKHSQATHLQPPRPQGCWEPAPQSHLGAQ